MLPCGISFPRGIADTNKNLTRGIAPGRLYVVLTFSTSGTMLRPSIQCMNCGRGAVFTARTERQGRSIFKDG